MPVSLLHVILAIMVISGVVGAGAIGYSSGLSQGQHDLGCGSSGCASNRIQADSQNSFSVSTETVDNLTVSIVSGYTYKGVNCAIKDLNLSAIQQEFGSNMSEIPDGNATQYYLTNPQYIAFLSQFLNMTDPYFNYSVNNLLGGNVSTEIQNAAINATSC